MAETDRRAFVAGAVAALSCASPPAQAAPAQRRLIATPGQVEGPFYPVVKPRDIDADLIRVEGAAARALGTVATLAGRVLDRHGRPLAGAVVEIWQCDSQGVYRHPGDPGAARFDQGFQGYGRTAVTVDGRYSFRTLKPGRYAGRAPHIHAAVISPGQGRFVTQLYVQGDPDNNRDGLLNSIGDDAQRASIILAYRPNPAGEGLTASYDFVLRG